MEPALPTLLDDGVARGIITAEQREALLRLGQTSAAPEGQAPARAQVTIVTVAYSLGALLVMFAAGWFLAKQWDALGGAGVLAVALLYAALLTVGGVWAARHGFVLGARVAWMLAVSLTPLVAWSLLDLTGEWPARPAEDALWRYTPYISTRFLVLDLATVLVALVVWRRRRFPELMLPLAIALWWTFFHLARVLEVGAASDGYQNWIVMTAALTLLAIADGIERWQRRTGARREGDFAEPMWYCGVAAFSIAYMILWSDANGWKHLMPVVAAGLLLLSIVSGRKFISIVGMLGVFGYLAWLASEVFEDSALFPLVLAALGIAMVFATVWLQRRIPAFIARLGGTHRGPTWPPMLSWLPVLFALGMVGWSLRGADERAAERERALRNALLENHRRTQQGLREGRPPRVDSLPRPAR
ncbi:MAG: hypothetical protein IT361_05110 [Gemmatimonadaceae bacterium]|nr:hypothetical protein [Gemmatimonadaceae bacterium]